MCGDGRRRETKLSYVSAYAAFGTSLHVKATTSSTMAIMSASVVASAAGGEPAAYVALTAALALIVGAMLVAGGLSKLGFISDFLAKPVDAPLHFFNANVAHTQILELVAAQEPAPRAVLIDLGATADLDVTIADTLAELVASLRSQDVEMLLAEARGAVRDRLLKMGLMAEVGQERIYLSVGAGVSDFLRRWPPSPTAAEPPDPAATGVDAPPESPATGQ